MEIKNIEGLSVAEIKDIVKEGGKFVYFPYTISIVLMTFKRNSAIYLIRPTEGSFKHSFKFVLANSVLGWWGLPWGPIHTVTSIYHQARGGKDITAEVLHELLRYEPAEPLTGSIYNIDGNQSHTGGNPSDEKPIYNIPR